MARFERSSKHTLEMAENRPEEKIRERVQKSGDLTGLSIIRNLNAPGKIREKDACTSGGCEKKNEKVQWLGN